MTLRIREALPADARAIAEIHVRSWQAAYRGQLTDDYLDGLSVDDRLEQHRRSLEEPPAEWRTWVAQDGDVLAGFVVRQRSITGLVAGYGARQQPTVGLTNTRMLVVPLQLNGFDRLAVSVQSPDRGGTHVKVHGPWPVTFWS